MSCSDSHSVSKGDKGIAWVAVMIGGTRILEELKVVECIDENPLTVTAVEDNDWKVGISSFDSSGYSFYSEFAPVHLGFSQRREDHLKLYMIKAELAELTFDEEVDISAWETDVALKTDTAHLNQAKKAVPWIGTFLILMS